MLRTTQEVIEICIDIIRSRNQHNIQQWLRNACGYKYRICIQKDVDVNDKDNNDNDNNNNYYYYNYIIELQRLDVVNI
jgi:hypothetical protein